YGARPDPITKIDRRLGRAGGDPYDPRNRPSIEKKLLNRIAEAAVGVEAAEGPFKIAEIEDFGRLVGRSPAGVSDEGGYRGRHASNRTDAAGYFFDVDSRLEKGRGHFDSVIWWNAA